MTISLEQAIQRVHEAGLRMSRPREILLQLILSTEGPFSVKMLHERTERAGLNMHLATVHRNLADFVQVGLVDEMPGEDNRLYACHEEHESGVHVFCLDCRNFVPLEGSMMNQDEASLALSQALSDKGFDASTMRFMLSAHCKIQQPQECAQNEQ